MVGRIADLVQMMCDSPSADIKIARQEARKIATRAEWKNFIKYYYQGYDMALRKAQSRIGLK